MPYQPKPDIPELHQNVIEARFIGPYIRDRLADWGIFTIGDLVDYFVVIADLESPTAQARRDVKEWLQEVVVNARPLSCVYPRSMVIDGTERAYKTRYENFKAFNAILKIWRHYLPPPFRDIVPRSLRGKEPHNKYPDPECRMGDIEF